MARYGPNSAAVTYASQSIADVTVIGDLERLARMAEITPIGAVAETHAFIGVTGMPPVTLEAPYSDDSNLLRDKVDDTGLGGTATLLITFGGTKTMSVSTIVTAIRRNISRGNLTMFAVDLQPTGTVTEA